jgi:hypothetical protein
VEEEEDLQIAQIDADEIDRIDRIYKILSCQSRHRRIFDL